MLMSPEVLVKECQMTMTTQDMIETVKVHFDEIGQPLKDWDKVREMAGVEMDQEETAQHAFVDLLLMIADHQESHYGEHLKSAARQWLTENVSGIGEFDSPDADNVTDGDMVDMKMTRIIHRLIDSYNAWMIAQRPSDNKIARANFEGMVEMVHEFGYGMTPTAVHMVVADAYTTIGARPGQTADNRGRKEWSAQMVNRISEALEDIECRSLAEVKPMVIKGYND
jgi:hypothetical protein